MKKGFWKILLCLFLFHCTLFTAPSFSYALEVKKHFFPSGLTVLHVERHNLPVVMMTLLIKASPLNETYEKAGTAFFTSKLLTEGTEKRTALQISSEIDFIGASLGASTNSDYTTVSLAVLKKDVEKGFDVFSDVLLHPLFPEDELARKKEQVKGALKQKEEEPSFVAEKAFIKAVFGARHPYGRLVEGSPESIDAITRADLLHFYRRYYVPGNALLSVVGDITSEELDSLLTRYMGAWKSGDGNRGAESEGLSAAQKGYEPETQKGPRVVVINKDITQANIVLGHIGIARDNPDYYAVSVMNYILGGGGFASRLMKTVRDDLGLAYSIYSSFAANKEPGQFEVEVQTKNESAAPVIQEIVKQIRRIRTEPVSEQEMDDAKAYLTGSFPRRLETSRKIADFLTAVQFYRLGDDYVEKYPEYIKRVTREDILRVAQRYLNSDTYVLVVVGNQEQMKLSGLQPSEEVR